MIYIHNLDNEIKMNLNLENLFTNNYIYSSVCIKCNEEFLYYMTEYKLCYECKDEDKIEEWRKINDSNYIISNMGRIMNIKSNEFITNNNIAGYYNVNLSINDDKRYSYRLNRLLAYAFIPNLDESKKIINHKDGDKLNNKIFNLEWSTQSDNINHSYQELDNKARTESVIQMDLDGKEIKKFDSITKASNETGAARTHISSVCNGKRKSCGGYKWKYDKQEDREEVNLSNFQNIPNFPKYKIDINGTIYSEYTKKILKSQLVNGYLKINLKNNKKEKNCFIHQLVAITYIPNLDKNKKFVNHKDGNRSNNNKNNLEWCTISENNKHSYFRSDSKRKNKIRIIKKDKNTGKILDDFKTKKDAYTDANISKNIFNKYLDGEREHDQFIWEIHSESKHIKQKTYSRKVKCIDIKTNKTIAIYNSMSEASRETGAQRGHISSVCTNSYGRNTAGGYKWEYVENDIILLDNSNKLMIDRTIAIVV